jgi:PAS domain S-box-containing protein
MTRPLGSVSPMLRSAALAAAFACLYFLTTKVTGWLTTDPAVLWPASGVYLGVMLLAPRRSWPVLACAAGVGSFVSYLHGGASLDLSVAFAVPSSAEGLLAALLVERLSGGRFTLGGVRDLRALVVGVVVANGLVALSAAAVAAQSFDASFGESWLRWWSADALGMLAVVPILTAGRRSMRATALGGLGVALVAAQLASEGYAVQGFLAVLLVGSLALAAAAADRERLRDDLGSSKEELERRRKDADHASHKLEGSAERLERAGRRIAQLTAELAARSAEVHEATRRHERLAADLRDSNAARERTERELADARRELSRATSETEALEEELSRVGSQNIALEEALSRMGHQNGALEEELSRVRAERRALEEAASRVGQENAALEEQLSRAGQENTGLEEELSRASSRNAAMEEDVSRVSSQNAALEEELSRETAERRALEEELERVRQELAAGPPAEVRDELEQADRARADAEQALEQARALLLEERARNERELDEIAATLARTEAERRLLAEHATELIARYDERGSCLYASPAARRLLGYEPEELVARPGAELLHPDDRHLLSRARAARSESTFQARLRHRSGDYIPVEVRLRPVLAHGGDRVVAVTTTIRELARDRDLAAA